MKGKLCIIIFGLAFLAAIIGEIYFLNEPQPHLFSIGGIGIVVILTGYLFISSVCELIVSNIKKKELIWEEFVKKKKKKWDSRYTELLNIQKATYTALKKNDTWQQEQIEDLSEKLAQIIELQNKLKEGQIKALNVAVNYSREHTKELLDAIKEEKENKEAES